ncbi:MAG: hypothetical protein ACRDZP_05695, partial [Acidimicrobiales bacterium]
ASPGGRCSARLWLHNTESSTVNDLRAWAAPLVSHVGGRLGDGVVTFEPERVSRLDPGESRELLAMAEIPIDAAPGLYHGQVLVERLPELVLPVTVTVLAAPISS